MAAIAGPGGSGAIVPGDAAASLLIERIEAERAADRMPPPDSGKSLSEAEREVLRRWIDAGAEYQDHWAFLPVVERPLPEVAGGGDLAPIDRWIRSALEQRGLAPAPRASRRTLIRRVAFDLTGLPPTDDDLRSYLEDRARGAYRRMVDRFLASPHYGEHMARQWLDLARYADTSGYQYDRERVQWAWRDWVIDAWNRNLPFDQFTVEQLAGDLLPGRRSIKSSRPAFTATTRSRSRGA